MNIHIPEINWGARTLAERVPIITGYKGRYTKRNVIGAYAGIYAVFRALGIAMGRLDAWHMSDLTGTAPVVNINQNASWGTPAIVTMDPWGCLTGDPFYDYRQQGYDIRPTISITTARSYIPEIREAIAAGRLIPDGKILSEDGSFQVIKASIDPVWFLPGIAERLGVTENHLRRSMYKALGGAYPALKNRLDLKVFLPPIGGQTVYFIGDINKLSGPDAKVAGRIHDECNSSDVFGSDICTCRPYLMYGVEESIRMAQADGVGFILYNHKEGRALGEVVKFLVYNARSRQAGGDRPEEYFNRTKCVAGLEDNRFQELMPDVLLWLGVERIDRLVSMSNDKHDALRAAGIEIVNRIPIPKELIPGGADIEIDAKCAKGYHPLDDKAYLAVRARARFTTFRRGLNALERDIPPSRHIGTRCVL